MIFLTELEIETKIPEHKIFQHFNNNNMHVGAYYSGKKFLGFGVSDEIGEIFKKRSKK